MPLRLVTEAPIASFFFKTTWRVRALYRVHPQDVNLPPAEARARAFWLAEHDETLRSYVIERHVSIHRLSRDHRRILTFVTTFDGVDHRDDWERAFAMYETKVTGPSAVVRRLHADFSGHYPPEARDVGLFTDVTEENQNAT